jgi:multidrug efflux pump
MIRRTRLTTPLPLRINGQPALALEILKRSGANIIETVAAVKAPCGEVAVDWPESVGVPICDQSKQVKDPSDLEANVSP